MNVNIHKKTTTNLSFNVFITDKMKQKGIVTQNDLAGKERKKKQYSKSKNKSIIIIKKQNNKIQIL